MEMMETPKETSMNEFINKLLSEMTLEEKISQMLFAAPGIERLGIAPYNWWNECLHGLGRAGAATVFPQSIGLAATWNPELMNQIATVISDEARAKHHEAKRHGMHNIYAGLTFWTPTINIFRDPRWGRGQETYGEDPYLTADLAVAFIKGLQGDDPNYLKLVATAKHYAVHSGPESSRHYFDAEIEEWKLREFYLFAFEACIKEAKAESIMGAYNRVNGEPCCSSSTLLTKILRYEWGFDGYVVSDCEAIQDIFANHRVVDSPAEAAALAVGNGCDLNCGIIYLALLEALQKGLISEEEIDRSVRRLMTTRYRLGMFKPDDEVPYAQIPYEVVNSPEHRLLALRAAQESIILLKNDDDFLPLTKDTGSIAVIGPNADDVLSLLGNYNGTPINAVTPLEGIRRIVSPTTQVEHSRGCEITKGIIPLSLIPSQNLSPEEPAQGASGLSASYFDNAKHEGQPVLTRVDPAIDFIWADSSPISGQWGAEFSAVWEGYLSPSTSGTFRIGVNGYSEYHLLLNGKTVIKNSFIHHPQLNTIDLDLEAGEEIPIRLEYANIGLDPQIQLLWSPLEIDYKKPALELAKNADVVIAVMGLSPALEGEEMPVDIEGFIGGDRTDIRLPSTQLDLLKEIHAMGKPVILVLLNGSAMGIGWATDNLPAIIEAWYPGQEGGQAIADVIFGDYNPGGKLPVTFYRSTADLPPFEDYSLVNRTYRYFQGEPLYPFGHGLSYTTFHLSDFAVDHSEVIPGDEIKVSVRVSNDGDRSGDSVIQLYLRHPEAGILRPTKKLVGFQRVHLSPGQQRHITFKLKANQLAFYDKQARFVLAPGFYELYLGNSSQDLPFQATIEVQESESSQSPEKVFFSETIVD